MTMQAEAVRKCVAELVEYAVIHLGLEEDDRIYAANAVNTLVGIDGLDESKTDRARLAELDIPDTLVEPLVAYAVERGTIERCEMELFSTAVMGAVTPKPSEVNRKFFELYGKSGADSALSYFYNFCIKNDYIKKSRVAKNKVWSTDKGYGLVCAINLSKPEKSNEEIRRLQSLPQVDFPKCMLCKENVNYKGRLNYPARQTLRYIPLNLCGEEWYFQYSPYVYFNEHCIVFSDKHSSMTMTERTFVRLKDFLDYFPKYFIGSNACLPIVGGSILNHEHFQGGRADMPLFSTRPTAEYSTKRFQEVRFFVQAWYNTCIRLVSRDGAALCRAATELFDFWQSYTDETVGVIAKTNEQHNAVTPIMRKVDGEYVFYMILRNNRTDEQYPDGIFHAHPEFHKVKKEGIGIIECVGTFILPPRLIEDYPSNAGEIEQACVGILNNTAVFKSDAQGQAALNKFLVSFGLKKL